MFIFGTQMHIWMGVWQDQKCHGFEDFCPIVPRLKMMSCPVLFQMSRCIPVHPDVPVSSQHFYMLLTVMFMCDRCVYI